MSQPMDIHTDLSHIHLDADAIRQRYDGRAGADHMAAEFSRETLLFSGWMRRRIFSRAQGDILDVACGSGENFRYLNRPGNHITAVELSPIMLANAAKRAVNNGMKVDLKLMDAEHLEFPDASFDTVVSALSTCTFPDPAAALREMQRVCKPDGRILLFEHGRSTWGWVARWQDKNTPTMYESAGCRFNQEPLEVVQAAGLHVLHAERHIAGVFHLLEISPR
jgi:ubiquinone/menaquinone biosynthesis C-methylase UbiE